MAEKLAGSGCAQMVSNRKQSPLMKLACICILCEVHSNLQRVPVMARQLVVFLVKDPSLLCVVSGYGHVLQ